MAVHVLTQRNAPDRRGVNRQETILNPRNVNFSRFGRVGSYPVKGSVYAQPLFVSGVDCGAKGTRNLVIVATMENSVYAFDADQEGAGAQIWPQGSPGGLELGQSADSGRFQNGRYGDFYRKPIGILSTPVISLKAEAPAAGIIYLVSFQFDQAGFASNQNTATPAMFAHILYALDLGTGKILRQAKISGKYPGGGYAKTNAQTKPFLNHTLNIDNAHHSASMTIDFDRKQVEVVDATGLDSPQSAVHFNSIMQLQRPGLLLQDGNLLIAFGSRGDEDPYHGWVFSYEAASFGQTGVFCTTPNGIRGGIWQAGQGLVQDSKKNFYASTGNGDNDEVASDSGKSGTGPVRSGRNLGESFLGFRRDATGVRLNGWFSFFKDFNQVPTAESNNDTADDDFGAGSPALLPDDRVVAGGKDGWFFLIDPDQLDKVSSRDAVPQAFKASFNRERGSRSGIGTELPTRHIHGSPVVWDTLAGQVFVYVWGENDVVRVYQYLPEANEDPLSGRFLDQPRNFQFDQPPPQGIDYARGNIYASNEVRNRRGMPGGFLALTQNGEDSSTAILWAAYPPRGNANPADVGGALVAYDASKFDVNLAYKRLTMLWNSQQVFGDGIKHFVKFCCPTVANGRVYQATGGGEVAIYGPRTRAVGVALEFDGSGGGFALNGSARLSQGGTVVLTEHAEGQENNANDDTPTFLAGSFFTQKPFDIRRFATTFTFRLTAAAADGFTFTIQAEGPRAIGSSGSGLGYTIDRFAPFESAMQSTILHSFAVKFGLRDAAGAPASHLALLVNGAQLANFVDIDLLNTNPGPIDLRSGNEITARLRYDGNMLAVQLRDDRLGVSTQDFQLIAGDIAQQINSTQGQAFIGFTGGTGGLSARQEIIAWRFEEGVPTS
jgi:hypothetical protein